MLRVVEIAFPKKSTQIGYTLTTDYSWKHRYSKSTQTDLEVFVFMNIYVCIYIYVYKKQRKLKRYIWEGFQGGKRKENLL